MLSIGQLTMACLDKRCEEGSLLAPGVLAPLNVPFSYFWQSQKGRALDELLHIVGTFTCWMYSVKNHSGALMTIIGDVMKPECHEGTGNYLLLSRTHQFLTELDFQRC